MNIFKLKYESEQQAIIDLKSKGVLVETEETDGNIQLSYGEGIHSVVNIGKIIDVEGTYDENGNELTPPTYINGYHFDVMCEQEISFDNAIEPKNPKHQFAGYES
jgi:carbonic anhydrase